MTLEHPNKKEMIKFEAMLRGFIAKLNMFWYPHASFQSWLLVGQMD